MLFKYSLNKSRLACLLSVVAALSLIFGMTRVAPAQAQEIGSKVSVNWGTKGYYVKSAKSDRFPTQLFKVQAGSEQRFAYCTEYDVLFKPTDDAEATSWDKFPGNNKFKTDQTTREKINWIAANSYPAISYEETLSRAGLTASQASVESVMAQTQGAIWSLASDFDYQGLAAGQGTAEEQANGKKLFEYLTGSNNVGRAESTSLDLEVGFNKDNAKRQANGTYGPFVLNTNAQSLTVKAEKGEVVDKDGKAFPAGEIKAGQEFYFKAEEQAGEAKLTATAAASEINGALVIAKNGNSHNQTLILTHDKTKTKDAELYIKWDGTDAKLSTTAHNKDNTSSQRIKSKGGVVVDVVKYEGLIVGKEYTLKGQIWRCVKQDDGTCKGEETNIKAEKKFTPTEANGQVEMEFTIPEGYNGQTLVVFEKAYDASGKLIAEHTDINDKNQTIYVNEPYEDLSGGGSAGGSSAALLGGSSQCLGGAGGSSKDNGKNSGSLGDLASGSSSLFGGGSSSNGNGNGNGGSTDNGGSNSKDGSAAGSTGNGGAKGGSKDGSAAGSSGNGGANASTTNDTNAASAGGSSNGCGGALALGALAIGGLVLTAVGFTVLNQNRAPLAGAADPKSDTKSGTPAGADPSAKNAADTKAADPNSKGVAQKAANTQVDVKNASPAATSKKELANTGVSGILIMLIIAAIAAVLGGVLIFRSRRANNK